MKHQMNHKLAASSRGSWSTVTLLKISVEGQFWRSVPTLYFICLVIPFKNTSWRRAFTAESLQQTTTKRSRWCTSCQWESIRNLQNVWEKKCERCYIYFLLRPPTMALAALSVWFITCSWRHQPDSPGSLPHLTPHGQTTLFHQWTASISKYILNFIKRLCCLYTAKKGHLD